MGQLTNKVATVTGGSSGIGRAIALYYAQEGAKVMIADMDSKEGEETVKMIKNKSGEAAFMQVDVSKPEENKKLVNETVKKYGALHIACNNAGISGASAPTGEYPVESWDQVIAVNLSGVFYGMRYQIPEILKAGGGAIVNMASILGQVGFMQAPAYVAAKHGVVGMTKTAAMEYAQQKIRINSVGPAFIETPLLSKNLDQETIDSLKGLHPIGRLGTSEEVAELVLWLSSEKASFVTGSYYPIDGGYLAQ